MQDTQSTPVLQGIKVYPNPSQSLINVLFNAKTEGEQYKLVITDINGKDVYTKQGAAEKGLTACNSILINSPPPFMYFGLSPMEVAGLRRL